MHPVSCILYPVSRFLLTSVRKHSLDICNIGFGDQRRLAQPSLPGCILAGEQMALPALASLDLACSGHFQSLCRASIRF